MVTVVAAVCLSVWSVVPEILLEHGWLSPFGETAVHSHAAGAGSWALVVAATGVCLLKSAKGTRELPVAGILLMITCAAALVAARCASEHQVTAALRWLYASAFVALSGVVWLCQYLNKRIYPAEWSRGWGAGGTPVVVLLLVACYALPVTALTCTFAFATGAHDAILPAGLVNHELRLLLLGPCLLVAVGLMGFGRATRRRVFGIATVVLTCVAATVTGWCVFDRAGIRLAPAHLVRLVQLNVLLTASVAILWRLLFGWDAALEKSTRFPVRPLLICRGATAVVLFLTAAGLWTDPGGVSASFAAVGTLWGVLAVALNEFALYATKAGWNERGDRFPVSVWGLFAAVLLAAALAPNDTGNWLCFHALMLGLAACGGVRFALGAANMRRAQGADWREALSAAADPLAGDGTIKHDFACASCGYNLRRLRPDGQCPECGAAIAGSLDAAAERLSPERAGLLVRLRSETVNTVLACAGLAAVFAIRAVVSDPGSDWWAVGALAAAGALCMGLAAWAPRRGYAWVGSAGVCLAASVWWVADYWSAGGSIAGELHDVANVNVIALALCGIAWAGLELRVLRPRLTFGADSHVMGMHRLAVLITCSTVLILSILAFEAAATEQLVPGRMALRWLGWGAAVALVVVCTRDSAFRQAALRLYVLGLAALLFILSEVGLTQSALLYTASLVLSGYVLLIVIVSDLARRKAAVRAEQPVLPAAHGIVAAVSLALALYVSFADPSAFGRTMVAASPLFLAVAAARSATRAATDGLRANMQSSCLGLFAVAVLLLVWAWLPSGRGDVLLVRSIGVVGVVSLLLVAASGLRRIERASEWRRAMTQCGTVAGGLAGTAIAFCVAMEVYALTRGPALQLSPAVIAFYIVSLVILIASALAFAVHGRWDPLQLPAHRKGVYVYAAEGLAAVLVLHVRASMPWLFSGVITQYWPLILMGIASAAIVAGEVCARRGPAVLSGPFARTGMFLPALGLLELFLATSVVHFSIVLLTMGVVYAWLAMMRKSALFGLLAAMSINGSLWYLLYHTPGLRLHEHPQLWLIPPALAVLVAGHLNRARLDEEQRKWLRYACLVTMYVSSTADIFLIGVARAPWLPLVLAGLSLGGILAGFLSRCRSFLFVGSGFLCLSLLTMVWHAASNLGWTWVWYVAGIALGVSIITVFALFERRRNDVHAWLGELRHWAG
jgi:hypothetical protein